MTDLDSKIQELHGTYCRLTGIKLNFNMSYWLRWEQFIKVGGHTPADLELVITYIRKRIKSGERRPESFRLYHLIDEERFAEDLSFARAAARTPRINPGQAQALRATGRSTEIRQPDAQPVGKLLESQAFKDFQALKDKIKRGDIL